METQDHKLRKNSGKLYSCQKCGWPFPNPHPSAKLRRAHKNVCGKIEGYKLGDDVADKTQLMNGSDGKGKTPIVENTISRKSSSGIGSESSRAPRPEEELLADAATDFGDGSDDTNITAENGSSDNTCVPNSFLKDNQDQVQNVSELASENDSVEPGIVSRDHMSSSAIGLVEQDMKQLSKTPHELDIVANASKEIVSSEQKHELKTSYDKPALEASENASGLRATDEVQDSISIAKLTRKESANSENNIESSHVVDALHNFSSLEQSVEVIDATNGITGKLSDATEDHGLKTETLDDFHVLAVPDALPLHRLPDIGVQDPEVGYTKKICSEDDDLKSVYDMEGKLKQGVEQNSMADPSTVGEPDQLPAVEDSDADGIKLRGEIVKDFMSESLENEKVSSRIEEQKPIHSLVKAFAEGGVSNKKDHVQAEVVNGEITTKELSGTLLLADCATHDIPPLVKELGSIDDGKDMFNNRKTRGVETHLEGNERSDSDVNKPGYGVSVAGSHQPERTFNYGESDVTQDSRDVKVDRSLTMIEGTQTSSGGAESILEDGQGVLKSAHLPGSISNMIPGEPLVVCEDAQCSLRNSSVNDISIDKFVDKTSGAVESDTTNPFMQRIAISAVDVPTSNSQADSLEGNWGSVSALFALSDTPPATDTLALTNSRASPAEQNVSLEPKFVTESHHSDSQTSGDPNTAVTKTKDISEIQALEEQQPKDSVSSGHMENASLAGKRDEKIIAEVTNRSTEKNHTTLKTLLDEDAARSGSESPIHYNQSSTSVLQKAEILLNNGFSTTRKVIHTSNDCSTETSKNEDSPSGYPVKIKTQKKRDKTKSWVPFFCCSSVNAKVG